MGLLERKVCVITGGAGSVGLASAQAFVREGAQVMLVDLRESDLDRAARMVASPNAVTYAADVSQIADTKAYIDATVARWGKIDVLFSNAGTSGVVAPVPDYPEDVFDSVIAVHVRGAFLACRYGLPRMNDGGSIIITSSIVGLRGDGGGACAYVTAKHAQVGLMRSVAKGAARRNIRVNTLHPGPIDNEFQLGIERGIRPARRSRCNRDAQRGHPAASPRPPRRDRARGAVPRFRPVELHHRSNLDGRRRA